MVSHRVVETPARDDALVEQIGRDAGGSQLSRILKTHQVEGEIGTRLLHNLLRHCADPGVEGHEKRE